MLTMTLQMFHTTPPARAPQRTRRVLTMPAIVHLDYKGFCAAFFRSRMVADALEGCQESALVVGRACLLALPFWPCDSKEGPHASSGSTCLLTGMERPRTTDLMGSRLRILCRHPRPAGAGG